MAENREPPPDLFDAEENLSEDETLEEPKPAEDKTIDDVQETVEVSLGNEENGKDEPVETSEDEDVEPTISDSMISDDPAPKEAEKEAEKSPESPDIPEEKKDVDKSENKVIK